MQTAQFRLMVVAGVLVAGNVLLHLLAVPPPIPAPRWPVDDSVYAAPGWAMTPLRTEEAHRTYFVSREYRRPDAGIATLTIATSPEAKKIYQAGAEVPLLGAGYLMEPAPPELAAAAPGIAAAIATRGTQRFLVLHAEGERRGFNQHLWLKWGFAFADGILRWRNDYFKLTLTTGMPVSQAASRAPAEVAALARAVFPRIAGWYASPPRSPQSS
jgi:hypothetical protein